MKRYRDLPPPTTEQREIIFGSLLGDGSITSQQSERSNCSFSKTQKSAFLEYVLWHFDSLAPFSCSISPKWNQKLGHDKDGNVFVDYSSNVRRLNWKIATFVQPFFTECRKIWYPLGQKIVPPSLVLTPLSLAVWYCDDGHNTPQRRSLYLHTNGFTVDDCNLLISKMSSDLTIESKLSFNHNRPQIGVFGKNYFKFIEVVRPHVPFACMQYKIDVKDCPKYKGLNTKLAANDVIEIVSKFERGNSCKDIADHYGINANTVRRILRGERWKHLDRPLYDVELQYNNKSGVSGVSFDKESQKWRVIKVSKGKKFDLGRFKTFDEAVIARLALEDSLNEC